LRLLKEASGERRFPPRRDIAPGRTTGLFLARSSVEWIKPGRSIARNQVTV
jgi:hypothetical protein